MTFCNHCHAVMTEFEVEETRQGEAVCSTCGSDDLSDAVRCERCGEWTSEDNCKSYTSYLESPPRRICVCEDCTKRTLIEFDRIVKENFGATEQLILCGEGLYGDDIV